MKNSYWFSNEKYIYHKHLYFPWGRREKQSLETYAQEVFMYLAESKFTSENNHNNIFNIHPTSQPFGKLK